MRVWIRIHDQLTRPCTRPFPRSRGSRTVSRVIGVRDRKTLDINAEIWHAQQCLPALPGARTRVRGRVEFKAQAGIEPLRESESWMDPDIISSVGLSLDIAGVILTFIYGLPAGIAHEGDAAGMKWAPPDDEVEQESKRWERYKLLALPVPRMSEAGL